MTSELSRREKLALFQEQKRQKAEYAKIKLMNNKIDTNCNSTNKINVEKTKTSSRTKIASTKNLNNIKSCENTNPNLKDIMIQEAVVTKEVKLNTDIENSAIDIQKIDTGKPDGCLQSLLGFDKYEDTDSDDEQERSDSLVLESNIVTKSINFAVTEILAASAVNSAECKIKYPNTSEKSNHESAITNKSLLAMRDNKALPTFSAVVKNSEVIPEAFKGRKQTRVNFNLDKSSSKRKSIDTITMNKTPSSKNIKKIKRIPTPHHTSHPSNTDFSNVKKYPHSDTSNSKHNDEDNSSLQSDSEEELSPSLPTNERKCSRRLSLNVSP